MMIYFRIHSWRKPTKQTLLPKCSLVIDSQPSSDGRNGVKQLMNKCDCKSNTAHVLWTLTSVTFYVLIVPHCIVHPKRKVTYMYFGWLLTSVFLESLVIFSKSVF